MPVSCWPVGLANAPWLIGVGTFCTWGKLKVFLSLLTATLVWYYLCSQIFLKASCAVWFIELWSASALLIYNCSTHWSSVVIFRTINPGKWAIWVEKQLSQGILIMENLNNCQITVVLEPPVIAITKSSDLMVKCCDENWIEYLWLNWEICLHIKKASRDLTGLCPLRWRLEKERKIIFPWHRSELSVDVMC